MLDMIIFPDYFPSLLPDYFIIFFSNFNPIRKYLKFSLNLNFGYECMCKASLKKSLNILQNSDAKDRSVYFLQSSKDFLKNVKCLLKKKCCQ